MKPRHLAFAFAFISSLISTLSAAGQVYKPSDPPVNIMVNYVDAQALIRVNGIPVQFLPAVSGEPQASGGTQYLMFTRNGDNLITVECKIVKPAGYVSVKLYDSVENPPLFDQTCERDQTLSHTLKMAGLPDWIWTGADKVATPKDEIMAAVQALHAAFAKKDVAYVRKTMQGGVDARKVLPPEMQSQMPSDKQREAELAKSLGERKLLPLPAAAELTIESYADGRLHRVTRKDQKAPILLEIPQAPAYPWAVGLFWAKLGGQWVIVR